MCPDPERGRKQGLRELLIYTFENKRTTEFDCRFCNSSSLALATRLENHREEVLVHREIVHLPHCLWKEWHTFGSEHPDKHSLHCKLMFFSQIKKNLHRKSNQEVVFIPRMELP